MHKYLCKYLATVFVQVMGVGGPSLEYLYCCPIIINSKSHRGMLHLTDHVSGI